MLLSTCVSQVRPVQLVLTDRQETPDKADSQDPLETLDRLEVSAARVMPGRRV